MNKKGQFFLVAAVVVIGLVAGLVTVYNTAKTSPEDLTIFDLSDEIDFESAQVLDHGVYNEEDITNTGQNIEEISDFYSAANPDSELIVAYGNADEVVVIVYQVSGSGEITIDFGGGSSVTPVTTITKSIYSSTSFNDIEIKLSETTVYTFNLKPGQNFFVVLKKDKDDETFVSVPEEGEPADAN